MRHLRRWIAWGLGLLIVLSVPGHGAAQETSISIERYTEILRTANAAAQRNDLIGYGEAVQPLAGVKTVTLPNEQTIPLNAEWLLKPTDPKVVNPNLKPVQRRIGATLELLSAARPANPEDLERLASFINDFPYDYERLTEEFKPAPITTAGSGLGSFLNSGCLLGLAIMMIIAVIIYIAAVVRRNWVSSSKRKRTTHPQPKEVPFVAASSSAKAIEKADQQADSGDFRTGVRYLYLSTILWLAEHQVLAFDRTLTNREVLAAVPPNSPLRGRLTPVVQTFDEVWYGFHDIDQAAFERFRQQVTNLREGRA